MEFNSVIVVRGGWLNLISKALKNLSRKLRFYIFVPNIAIILYYMFNYNMQDILLLILYLKLTKLYIYYYLQPSTTPYFLNLLVEMAKKLY